MLRNDLLLDMRRKSAQCKTEELLPQEIRFCLTLRWLTTLKLAAKFNFLKNFFLLFLASLVIIL